MFTDEKVDGINAWPEHSPYLKMPHRGDWSLKFHVCSVFKKKLKCVSMNMYFIMVWGVCS
jgi:hypothetical protein